MNVQVTIWNMFDMIMFLSEFLKVLRLVSKVSAFKEGADFFQVHL